MFMVPYLFISKGSVTFAFQAVTISCVLVNAIYVYLFARLYLDRVSALIAANVIGLLPLVQIFELTFFSECALFPVMLGALYYLVQSDYFRHRKQTIGF